MVSDFIFYRGYDGRMRVQVFVDSENETVWMSQKGMAETFAVSVKTISEHLQNVFKEGELHENSVIRKIRITAADNKDYDTNTYNLGIYIHS